MRVNLASINTSGGQVTVIRPFLPEQDLSGTKFYAGVLKLVERGSITGLHFLGSVNGVSLWEAEWVSCPLDVPRSAAKGKVGLMD